MDKKFGKNSERKIVQDIMPSNRRTIRNIVPERISIKRNTVKKNVRYEEERLEPRPTTKIKRRLPGILLTFFIIFIGVAVIAGALSLLYSKAVVTITPKVAPLNVNGTITAKMKPVSGTALASELYYETIIVSDVSEKTIKATDGPLIQTKSKGVAILYNEQGTAQTIIAGTRLSDSDGLIYRTTSSVVIPAKKTAIGAISVGIVADKAGVEYDKPLGSTAEMFKVVAYKGGPKYEAVYAKQKTSIVGGFSGTKKIISADAKKKMIDEMKEELKLGLIEKTKAKVPEGSIMYKNAYSIYYEIPEPVSKDKDTAIISVKASIYGAVFKKDALIKHVAKRELDKFPSPTYEINMVEDLDFSLINSKDFSAKKGTPLIFSLKGPVTIKGTFSKEALKNELKGTYLRESNTIFARYPAIANAYALITPFWMRSFPNSMDKINVEIKN